MKDYAVYCTGITPEKGICRLTGSLKDNVSAWQLYGIPNPRLTAYNQGEPILEVDIKADTVENLGKVQDKILETLWSFKPKIGEAIYLVDQLRPEYAHMAFVRIK